MTNNERKAPVPGERFVHFKNKQYQIIAVATHSETREKMVIYQALYDDFGIYARPYDMFMSQVDHEKYPDVKQKYRFSRPEELVTLETVDSEEPIKPVELVRSAEKVKTIETMELDKQGEEEVNHGEVAKILLDFLDADTAKEKLEIIKYKAAELDDQIIDSLAASLDVVIDEGPLTRRIEELKSCLSTKMKYELERLR